MGKGMGEEFQPGEMKEGGGMTRGSEVRNERE